MSLGHHCLPNTHASPFSELAIHVEPKKAPSSTMSSPKEGLLPRDAQGFFFSWFVSSGISGRGRVEQYFGQECLSALFFSCNGRTLT